MLNLDDLNTTELVALARENDPDAHRGLGRDVLFTLITDTYEDTLPERKVDKLRLKIMGYILDHWSQVNPLLSCPAKTKNPRACFRCTDVQVVECAFVNPAAFDKTQGD